MPGRSLTVRLSDPLHERLDQAAGILGVPLNSLVSIACFEWLERHPGLSRQPVTPVVRGAFDLFDRDMRTMLESAEVKLAQMPEGAGGIEVHLGVLLEHSLGEGAAILQELGVSAQRFEDAVLGAEPLRGLATHVTIARRVFERSVREARHRGRDLVGTEHFVLAVMAEEGGRAFRALESLGITANQVERRIGT